MSSEYRNKINDKATETYDAEIVDKVLNEIEDDVNGIIDEIKNNDDYTIKNVLDDLNRLSKDLY